jgi:hypothetical protein
MTAAVNFSAKNISTPIVNVLVSGASGHITSGMILATNPLTAAFFCATHQLIREIFSNTAQYFLQNSNWTKENHKNSLTLLNLSYFAVAAAGSLALTAMVTSVALPIFDVIILLGAAGLLTYGTDAVIDWFFEPK